MRRLTIGCLLLIGRAALAQAQGTTPPEAAAPVEADRAVAARGGAAAAEVSHSRRRRRGARGVRARSFVRREFLGAHRRADQEALGRVRRLGGGFGFGGSISAGTGGGGVSINVSDYWRLTAMAEADIGRYFFVSFGPGVCGCTWGGISQVATSAGASQAAYVADGYFPELLARVGVGFGRTRHKFTLAVENMVAFGKMTQVSQNASMAGADQSVRIGNLAVGWTPGIVFGWDMR